MNNEETLLTKFFESISYYEIRKKALLKHNQMVEKYLTMPDSEFIFETIETTSRCERKKVILFIVGIALFESVIFSIWSKTLVVIEKLIIVDEEMLTLAESNKVIISVSFTLMVIMTILFAFVIYCILKQYYVLIKEKAFITEMKTIRKIKKDTKNDVEMEILIEKATPKKPNWVYDDEPLCPYCGEVLDGTEEYCDECDQRLDWSI